MTRSLFVFLLTCLCILPAFAQISAEQVTQLALQKNLDKDPQWIRLLHFQRSWGFWESQIDSKSFFLDPDGDKDPTAELRATIQSFWTAPNSPEENIPQCRYPARFKFLKAHLPEIKEWPDRKCTHWLNYYNALRGESLSLVFSSFYLNNPSSAFGHTFLRVNKKAAQNGQRFELLDYGINYSALVDTGNALLYAFKGLFGMFPGAFASVPYYYKVREYNNAESRDLWEYELNVTPEEVDMFLAHIWELGPAWINYWYLTENCSYHILTLIEAAAPRIDLISRLKKWVIPSDTVKLIWETPGLVRKVNYRPSVRTEFFARLKGLVREDQVYVRDFVAQKQIPAGLKQQTLERQQKILDTAIDYVDYKYAQEVQKASPEAQFKNELLVARSQIDLVSPLLKIEIPQRETPHQGHGSRKWYAGLRGSQAGDDGNIFGLKYALHEQTDLPTGYPEYANITFGDFRFIYLRESQKLTLDDFTLFEVRSFVPLSLFNRSFSWGIKTGIERYFDRNCMGCHAVVLRGLFGYTFDFRDEHPFVTAFLGVKGDLNYTPWGRTMGRLLPGAGPAVQIRSRWTDKFISVAEGWYRFNVHADFQTYQEYSLTNQYSFSEKVAVKLIGTDTQTDRKVDLDALLFF